MGRMTRVAIIGGGIGGLTAAMALRPAGAEVSVHEAAGATPTGAAPPGWPITTRPRPPCSAAYRLGSRAMDHARETLTWETFGGAAQELAEVIAGDGYRPDLILAIARGGMFVAGALGYALSVKNLHLMNVEFYNGVGSTLDMPVMLPPVPSAVDFSQKKVLIADDVADTGKTIELVRNFVVDHVAEVRSAVVYEKPASLVKCDYVWKRTDRWINFPWSTLPPVVPGVVDA
jgi:uncharacterized protein